MCEHVGLQRAARSMVWGCPCLTRTAGSRTRTHAHTRSSGLISGLSIAGEPNSRLRRRRRRVHAPVGRRCRLPLLSRHHMPTHARARTRTHAHARTMASPLAQAERCRPTATEQSERMARAGARHPSAFAAASAWRRRCRRCRRRTAQLRAVRYLSAIAECRKCSRVTSCIGSTRSTVWGYIDRVGLQASCVTDYAVPMPPSPVEADRSRACAQGCARVGEAEDP
jgi:hypothetical protein